MKDKNIILNDKIQPFGWRLKELKASIKKEINSRTLIT
jgi:hypothetical protein